MKNASSYVRSPAKITTVKRTGRGFSLNELKEAGLTLKESKKLELYVEKRRSVWLGNLKIIKRLIKKVVMTYEVMGFELEGS